MSADYERKLHGAVAKALKLDRSKLRDSKYIASDGIYIYMARQKVWLLL